MQALDRLSNLLTEARRTATYLEYYTRHTTEPGRYVRLTCLTLRAENRMQRRRQAWSELPRY